MRVAVDQSRKHSGIAEVDHLRASRNFDLSRRPNIDDALALDDHNLIGQQLAGLAVNQISCAQRNNLWRLREN